MNKVKTYPKPPNAKIYINGIDATNECLWDGHENGVACFGIELDVLKRFSIEKGNEIPIFIATNELKWTKIDSNNLPKGNVLAANFNINDHWHFNHKLVGSLFLGGGYPGDTHTPHLQVVCVSNGDTVLRNVTHYIDIELFGTPKE